jgi:hypothetical protein
MVERMARELERFDGAGHAARAGRDVVGRLEAAERIGGQLRAAWQAVAWRESCDWGFEAVQEALDKFGS